LHKKFFAVFGIFPQIGRTVEMLLTDRGIMTIIKAFIKFVAVVSVAVPPAVTVLFGQDSGS
jgi:hypothetical protein